MRPRPTGSSATSHPAATLQGTEWEGEDAECTSCPKQPLAAPPEPVHGVRQASSCLACPRMGNFSLVHDRFCPTMGQRKPSIDGFHLISITVIKTFAHMS